VLVLVLVLVLGGSDRLAHPATAVSNRIALSLTVIACLRYQPFVHERPRL
jgi:hypothetical protein